MTDEPTAPPPDPGPGAKKIDLDASRRARAEQRGPAPSIVFLERDWPLPRSLSADVIELVGEVMAGNPAGVTSAIETLLGGEVYRELKATAAASGTPLDLDDVTFLLEEVLEVYGVTMGESAASAKTS